MELKIGAVFTSNKVLKEKELPSWMYREEASYEEDSGWRIFSGNEDEDYLDNPDNFKLITSEQLIKIDKEIKSNLLAPYGFSFERDESTGKWMMVEEG
ncbi:DUF2185 domain-containing protein [uncultured Tenacibaculum sp.]|uniref:DUF2185 domain-containing protein n=1 Tax=uncultured Tenacibaculum sp. TaxID=174713 RepID=UPI002632F1DC|nr:DUF2185 domain-containing protein [uncultured Tenacibaculum sp.]